MMHWNGRDIVDISREFLNSNGAPKHATALCEDRPALSVRSNRVGFAERPARLWRATSTSCSQPRPVPSASTPPTARCSLLMPFGGKTAAARPSQAMASLHSRAAARRAETASVMAYGFDPYADAKVAPTRGAYLCRGASSMAKLVAAGAALAQGASDLPGVLRAHDRRARDAGASPWRALLGALDGADRPRARRPSAARTPCPARFEQMHVPPTLVSFAVAACRGGRTIISNEFKRCRRTRWACLRPSMAQDGLPDAREPARAVRPGDGADRAAARSSPRPRRWAWAAWPRPCSRWAWATASASALPSGAQRPFQALHTARFVRGVRRRCEGRTSAGPGDGGLRAVLCAGERRVHASELEAIYDSNAGECVPGARRAEPRRSPRTFSYRSANSGVRPAAKIARPRVLIPVFPGTNCEYDTERAFADGRRGRGHPRGAQPARPRTCSRVRGRVRARASRMRRSSLSPAASPAATSRTAPASSSPPSSAIPRSRDARARSCCPRARRPDAAASATASRR